MLLKDNLQVLSCFDGLGGGRLALQRLGITPSLYCASEIDPYAIKVHQANFPDTVQLGDITKLDTITYNNGKAGMLKIADNTYRHINLLIGGSPCQGFSFAGKQLNFDDPRSKLFFEFVKLKDALNPKYFLLENVKMKKESQDVISKYLGVEPIEINSNKFSAQNRKRLYWTNLPIDEIVDQGIYLHDILEDGCTDRTKSHCIDANYFKGGNLKSYFEKHRRQLVFSNEGLIHVGNADINGSIILVASHQRLTLVRVVIVNLKFSLSHTNGVSLHRLRLNAFKQFPKDTLTMYRIPNAIKCLVTDLRSMSLLTS